MKKTQILLALLLTILLAVQALSLVAATQPCTVCGGALTPDGTPVDCDHCLGTGDEPVHDPQESGGSGG